MKVPSYYVFIITLLMMGSSTIAQGSGTETDEKEKPAERLNFVIETNNLTQNEDDSVYPQISSSSENIYIVWQESVGNYGTRNYDIFFKKSNDSGETFGSPINLSNNTGFSEHPQIASVGNIIYIVWVDDSSGEREIMFCKSSDSGKTFSNSAIVSQNSIGPYHVELAAEEQSVYIVWNSFDKLMRNIILLSKSDDAGKTFSELTEIGIGDMETFPKIAADADEYFITWDKENDKDTEILFIKGHKNYDKINSITNLTKLNDEGIDGGETQVAANADHVLVAWTSNMPVDKKHVYVSSSINNGNDFGNSVHVSSINSSNVENIINDGNSYLVWQDNLYGSQDIFLTKSNMNGTSIDKAINVSNNTGISECPSITVSRNGIHMVWEDDTTGNHEVLYTRLSEFS
ncbi:MAG TPA: sialidase family protein [Nitrososphaeraceae archaeon]|nr:sialidase family protein [Nitrososphaeraceae archaeon]